jgi:hypothetical protein
VPTAAALFDGGGRPVTATVIPSMVVDDVELRAQSRPFLAPRAHPMTCGHLWEPHLWELNRAYCPRCGSLGRWVNDPRASEEAP